MGIPLDSGHRAVEPDYKLDIYLKIARLYLEDDNAVEAEAYVNRASLVQNESANAILRLKYKVCYARVLDSKKKFAEAAQRYYELSYLVSAAPQSPSRCGIACARVH